MIKHQKSGFTLIEIIVATGIFIGLFAGILTILITGGRTWYQEELSVRLNQNLRRSIDRITRELRESGCENDDTPIIGCETDEYKVIINDGSGPNNTDIVKNEYEII